MRVHPFPSRTRKLSSFVLKILGGWLPGKISRCRHNYCLLAQSVEHAAVNRRVVSSSLTEAAKRNTHHSVCVFFYCIYFVKNMIIRLTAAAAVNCNACECRRWRKKGARVGATVEKIEEKRKPDNFFGYRKRERRQFEPDRGNQKSVSIVRCLPIFTS